jgi:hypothetical protein
MAPVIGDVKGFVEAKTWGDYAIATITLIPGTDILKVFKKVPNPGGKLGDAVTRTRVKDVVAEIEARGNKAVTEAMVKTPNGYKKVRFADIAEVDPKTGKVIRYHQIGETTKKGDPVSRERKAKNDIENGTGLHVKFHDKSAGSSSSNGGSSGGSLTAQGTSSGWSLGKWWDSLWK